VSDKSNIIDIGTRLPLEIHGVETDEAKASNPDLQNVALTIAAFNERLKQFQFSDLAIVAWNETLQRFEFFISPGGTTSTIKNMHTLKSGLMDAIDEIDFLLSGEIDFDGEEDE
jgi:hypothetical protein